MKKNIGNKAIYKAPDTFAGSLYPFEPCLQTGSYNSDGNERFGNDGDINF